MHSPMEHLAFAYYASRVDPRRYLEQTYGVRRLATPPPPETRAMTRWAFDNARATLEQCSPDSNLHRVPGTVEAVVAEVLPGAQCSARWWYPKLTGTPGVPSGDRSVYGRITVTVPEGTDREALCLRLTAAVRNATEGPAPDIEVVW
jgi:hypothetical protein